MIIKDIFTISSVFFGFNGFLHGLFYGDTIIKDYERNHKIEIPTYHKVGYNLGSGSIGAVAGALYPITFPVLIYKSYIGINKLENKN